MPETLNDLIFSERRILTCPSGDLDGKNFNLAATAVKNIESIGFTIDQKGFEALSSASKEDIESWYYDTVSKLNDLAGNNHEYRPFYPNFPNEVMEKSDFTMFVDQMCHYWIGYMPEGIDAKANIKSLEEHPVKVLKTAVSDKEVKDISKNIFQNLLKTKQNLSEHERQHVLKTYTENVKDWTKDAETVTNRRNLGYLYAKAIMDKKDTSPLPSLVTNDILRLAKYLSIQKDGIDIDSVNLNDIDNTKIKSLPRSDRKQLCQLLDKQKNLEEDVARNKEPWKAAFKLLHVGEYRQFKNLNHIAYKVRSNKPLITFESKIEKAYKNNNIDKLISLYKQRPGVMIKSVNRLLMFAEKCDKPDATEKIMNMMKDVFPKTRIEDIISLDQYLNARTRDDYVPVHNVKGQFYINNKKEVQPISLELKEAAKDIIKNSIESQIKGKESLGNVYIEPEMYKMALPQDRQESSESMNLYTKGSRIAIEQNEEGHAKNVRAFIWWTNQKAPANIERNSRVDESELEDSRVDIDLSGAFFKNTKDGLSHTNDISYRTRRSVLGCTHSGDIVDGGPSNGKGVAEYIDFNLDSLKENGIDYVQLYINVYAGDGFNKQNCLSGWQERDELTKSQQFDVKAVQQTSKLSCDAHGMTPVILDVNKGEFIWVDSPDHNIKIAQEVISTGSKQMALLLNRYGHSDRMSMGEMAELHVKANGGTIVKNMDNPELEIDHIFSVNPVKNLPENCVNITAKEQDIWLGEMMTAYVPEEEALELTKELHNDAKEKEIVDPALSVREEMLDRAFGGKEEHLEYLRTEMVERESSIKEEYYKKYGHNEITQEAAESEIRIMKEEMYKDNPELKEYISHYSDKDIEFEIEER